MSGQPNPDPFEEMRGGTIVAQRVSENFKPGRKATVKECDRCHSSVWVPAGLVAKLSAPALRAAGSPAGSPAAKPRIICNRCIDAELQEREP